MKFRFSLEPVLRVREHREKVQKQKLAEKQRMKKVISEKKSKITKELEQFLGEKDKAPVHDIRKLRNAYAHLEQSHRKIGKLDREMNKADEEVNRERDKLVKAHRETHIMEKVKDREHRIFKEKINKAEQKLMDEISVQIFNK